MPLDDDDLPGEAPPAPAAKPAPKAPAPRPEPEPARHQHSTRLTTLALSMGFTQDDLDGYPSAAIWEEIERIRGFEQPKPQSAPEPKAKPQPEAPVDPDEATLAELERDYPAVGKLLRKALAREDLTPIKEKLAKIDQLEHAEQQRQVRAATRLVDAAFAALPEEYEEFVGSGPIEEVSDPGQRGWRGAIYGAAKILPTDGRAAVAAKVAAAAKAVCGDRVKAKPPPNPYEAAGQKPPKARGANGRFTAEEFEAGAVHRPNDKQTGLDQLTAVEAFGRYLKEHGDPRGDRAPIEFDEDLPG